jgi:hypothetical protein
LDAQLCYQDFEKLPPDRVNNGKRSVEPSEDEIKKKQNVVNVAQAALMLTSIFIPTPISLILAFPLSSSLLEPEGKETETYHKNIKQALKQLLLKSCFICSLTLLS